MQGTSEIAQPLSLVGLAAPLSFETLCPILICEIMPMSSLRRHSCAGLTDLLYGSPLDAGRDIQTVYSIERQTIL